MNFRVAGLLFAFVPIFGLPSVIGLGAGQFFANLSSPLGHLDLISPVFGVAGLVIIFALRRRRDLVLYGGYIVHSLLISLWVSLIISLVGGLSYFPLFYFVLFGNAVVDSGAFLLYVIIRWRFPPTIRAATQHQRAVTTEASISFCS